MRGLCGTVAELLSEPTGSAFLELECKSIQGQSAAQREAKGRRHTENSEKASKGSRSLEKQELEAQRRIEIYVSI